MGLIIPRSAVRSCPSQLKFKHTMPKIEYSRREKLKLVRRMTGLKISAIASELGVSDSHYGNLEMGHAAVKEDQVNKAREIFKKWRENEVKELQRLIDTYNKIEI